jgi:hypothetical protein
LLHSKVSKQKRRGGHRSGPNLKAMVDMPFLIIKTKSLEYEHNYTEARSQEENAQGTPSLS